VRHSIWPAGLALSAAADVPAVGCGGTPSAGSLLSARLLTVADLPAGWASAPANPLTAAYRADLLNGAVRPFTVRGHRFHRRIPTCRAPAGVR
jgi:hypothetical protein